jgi:ketosteroid isomerase-like protein
LWERISVEIRWIEGCGERVRAWLHQTHVGHESGAEVTADYGWDVTFRDGKIIRVAFFQEESRAFEGRD